VISSQEEGLKTRQGAYLPHWTKEGAIYSVTFRLADSLPKQVVNQWRAERTELVHEATAAKRALTDDELRRLDFLFSQKVDSYLDSGRGACWLREKGMAELVANALRHFDDERYRLFGWCVMPNHVHVVVQPLGEHTLDQILHSWKSFTAHEAKKLGQIKGEFWQAEYYDHLIRTEEDLSHPAGVSCPNFELGGCYALLGRRLLYYRDYRRGVWLWRSRRWCIDHRHDPLLGLPGSLHRVSAGGRDSSPARLIRAR
jgi:hypothetical protein